MVVAGATRAIESPLRRIAAELASDRIAMAALAVLAVMLAAALLAPFMAPEREWTITLHDSAKGLLPPGTPDAQGGIHWLGTDDQGRDMLSAIFGGLRISFVIALVSTLVALVIGVGVGLTAASISSPMSMLVMCTVELQLAFPAILICIVLLAVTGRGVGNLVVALVITQWAVYARTVYSAALAAQGKPYIEAAHGLALRPTRIVLRHLLPNCLSPVLVVALMQMISVIALEATLSFLRLGVPLAEPSLGVLIANGYSSLITGRYWISFFPGIALVCILFPMNVFTDRLRDMLHSRVQQ